MLINLARLADCAGRAPGQGPVRRYLLVWLGLLVGVGFYTADAFIDVFIFHAGSLSEVFFHPGYHKAWMRISVLVVAVAFGILAQCLLSRESLATARAQTAEKFLNSVIDNLPAMVFIKDAKDLRFVRVNTTGENLMGLSSAELLGKSDYDFFPDEQADFFTRKDREVLASGQVLNIPEEEIDTKDRGKRLLHTRKVPIRDNDGQPAFLLGISDDITDMRRAESVLQETEVRFQTLFDSAAEFIFVIETDGTILLTNKTVSEESGYTRDELTGKHIKELFTDKSQEVCECNFPALRKHGHNRAHIEFLCKNGRVLQMDCSATAIPDSNGEFTSFLIIQRDVTEQMQAATALVDSERRFRAIFNSTYQFIGLLDPEGTLLEANQASLDFIGKCNDEVVGQPFWETPWWTHSTEEQEKLRAAVQEAGAGRLVRFETQHISREGSAAYVDFSLKPVMNTQGEVILLIPEGRDITERKCAEEKALQHQRESAHMLRLSTMGEMTSGMAHELNQPLTALVSYCETARGIASAMTPPPEKMIDLLDRAAGQAHRAGDIIHHLRGFVSKGSQHADSVNVDQLVQDVCKFLAWDMRHNNIRLEQHLGVQGWHIRADKVQIEQVLVNLLRNSLEAIRDSGSPQGRIILETQSLPGDSIQVTVSDNGPGIDAGMLGKILNPFQTTKPDGMGLGLSISRSIIESCGGTLWADLEYRGGASFGFQLHGYRIVTQ